MGLNNTTNKTFFLDFMQRFRNVLDSLHRIGVSFLMASTVYLTYKVSTGLDSIKERRTLYEEETIQLYEQENSEINNAKEEEQQ